MIIPEILTGVLDGIGGRNIPSSAPSIFEHSDVKRGLLCLLFGGTAKDDANDKTKLRSEVSNEAVMKREGDG